MNVKTNAMRLLEQRGIAYTAHTFSPEIHAADGVAAVLGVPAHTVYKTLVAVRPRGRSLLVMVAGDRELDLRLLARSLGEKSLEMASHKEAEALTGLQVGGISALALLSKGFEVCIDRPALQLEHVYVSAGQRGINLHLRVADLVKVTGARAVEATKSGDGGASAHHPISLSPLLVLLAWLFLSLACSQPTPQPNVPLAVITVPELAPLAQELAAAYQGNQRGATVSVRILPSRQIPSALEGGPATIALTYPISPSQASQALIAWEGIAVTVAVTNPVENLGMAHLQQIFSGRLENWADVGGRPQAILPLSREEGAQSRALFEQRVMGQGARVTRNALILASDQAVVATVATTAGAIGYASLRALTPEVRPLRLEGVPPSVAAIQRGQYPLVLSVVTLTVGPPQGAAKSFLDFVQGREGQAILQGQGFVKAK